MWRRDSLLWRIWGLAGAFVGAAAACHSSSDSTAQASATAPTSPPAAVPPSPPGAPACDGATLPVVLDAAAVETRGVPICAPTSGYYTLELTYAKSTDGTATRTVLVDGSPYPGRAVFPPLWGTTVGAGGRRAIHLDAGAHTIVLATQQGDGGDLRVEKMTFSRGPAPSDESVRSLLMNDWSDLVVGWHAAKLAPNDDRGFGPRMTAFHWAKDWPVNQIDEAQAFFRDETAGVSYTDTHRFETTASFTATDADGYGEMRVDYGAYGGKALPIKIRRRMIVPPGERFAAVLYEVGNVSDGPRDVSILEWADLHNKTAGPSEDPARSGEPLAAGPLGTLAATWYPQYGAWICDMSQTNGTFIVFGSFGAMDHHVAGAPVTGGPDGGERGAATVKDFARGASTLRDADAFSGNDAGVGLSKTVTIAPRTSATIGYFYGAAESLESATALAKSIAAPGAPRTWIDQSSNAWRTWLASGVATSLNAPVPQWADALRIALTTNRQAQQPEFGSFVASTGPAYDYKVWPRDASVTAMSFDAAGYPNEAEKYWLWMASVQADGSDENHPIGSWWTNYRYWAKNEHVSFVEPELDSSGLFLIGVYRHHQALAARDPGRAARFLEAVWPAAASAADLIARSSFDAHNFGFGPKDFSIWEEPPIAYVVFTQTTYASGLRAAELLAAERQKTAGDAAGRIASSSATWAQARQNVRDAIFRDTTIAPCPGAWHAFENYFVRSVRPDCTIDARVDASTGLLWVFGLLEATNPRADFQRRAVLRNLSRGVNGYGITRYEGDTFYFTSPFSPAGQEANATPVWPQMSMYMAMLEHWRGIDDVAENRLSWYVATTAVGFEPPGEAVDWTTERPLTSTASEPVTAAWFELALLNQLGKFDPRLP